MTIQTAVTLKEMGYVSNLSPHMVKTKTWVGLENIAFVLFSHRKSDMSCTWTNLFNYLFDQNWDSACSVNRDLGDASGIKYFSK